jgi:hypothetical protein
MRLRPVLLFLTVSFGLLAALYFRAMTGAHLLAPLDLAPALFKHYAWVDPGHSGVPANHYIIDQLTYDLPLQRQIHAAVRQGQLPWWTPLDLGGRPLLADAHINGTDPLRLLLYRLLPFEAAYNWNLLIHSLLAGLGAFCLLRNLGSRPFLGGVLALTWQFSGPMTLYFGHPWIQSAFVAYPFLWLAWDRLAQGADAPALGGAALATAWAMLGGNLQSHAYLPLFAVAWLAGTCWTDPKAWLRLLPWVTVSGLLGALIAAPALAPELDLYRQTQRLPALTFKLIHVGAAPASLSFLFPWALGTFKTVDASKLFGQSTLGFQLFVGLPAGLAALGALLLRRAAEPGNPTARPANRRVAGLLLLGYVLILATPAVLFLYTRIAPLMTLALVVLAAEFLPRLQTESFPRLGQWLWRGGWALLAATTLAGLLILPKLEPKLEAALLRRGAEGTSMDEAPELRRAQARRLAEELSPANPELLLGLLSVLTLGWYCRRSAARRTHWHWAAIMGVGLLPLLAFQFRFAPSHPRTLWDRLLAGGPLQNELRGESRLGAIRFEDTLAGLHQQVFPNCFSQLYGVQTLHGYAALRPPHLLRTTNAPALLGDRPLTDCQLTLSNTVRRLPAEFTSRWIVRRDGVPVPHAITAVRESWNALELDFVAPGQGGTTELIWTDTFAPGWRAEFNGSPTESVQFERLFSRIKLPAAQGTVRLTYHPAGEGALRWLPGGMALLCGGALIVGMIRHRTELSRA